MEVEVDIVPPSDSEGDIGSGVESGPIDEVTPLAQFPLIFH